ncbi:hypothetical protein BdWA1_001578 [Babesia duncani]|uniref:Uncharacterized protein n=1 Tax=Babesia duncani TaxID=323732 RepID=A0AAD9PKE9_9APIC|nr:hypothetical protein BdWA1_001578 [Babesia duncani]
MQPNPSNQLEYFNFSYSGYIFEFPYYFEMDANKFRHLLLYTFTSIYVGYMREITLDIAFPYKNHGVKTQTVKLLDNAKEIICHVIDMNDMFTKLTENNVPIDPHLSFLCRMIRILCVPDCHFVKLSVLSNVRNKHGKKEIYTYYENRQGVWKQTNSSVYAAKKVENMKKVDMEIPCDNTEDIAKITRNHDVIACFAKDLAVWFYNININGLTLWLPENPFTYENLFAVVYTENYRYDAIIILTMDNDGYRIKADYCHIVNKRLHLMDGNETISDEVARNFYIEYQKYFLKNRPLDLSSVGKVLKDHDYTVTVEMQSLSTINEAEEPSNLSNTPPILIESHQSKYIDVIDIGLLDSSTLYYRKSFDSHVTGEPLLFRADHGHVFSHLKFHGKDIFKDLVNDYFFLAYYYKPCHIYGVALSNSNLVMTKWAGDKNFKAEKITDISKFMWTVSLDISTIDERFFNITSDIEDGYGTIKFTPKECFAISKIVDGVKSIRRYSSPIKSTVEYSNTKVPCVKFKHYYSPVRHKYFYYRKSSNGLWYCSNAKGNKLRDLLVIGDDSE